MADTFTSKFNFTKPEPGSGVWDLKLNDTLEKIDETIPGFVLAQSNVSQSVNVPAGGIVKVPVFSIPVPANALKVGDDLHFLLEGTYDNAANSALIKLSIDNDSAEEFNNMLTGRSGTGAFSYDFYVNVKTAILARSFRRASTEGTIIVDAALNQLKQPSIDIVTGFNINISAEVTLPITSDASFTVENYCLSVIRK